MNHDLIPMLVMGGVIVAFLVFKRAGQVSGAKARELVQQGALLLDVRTPAEFSSGHLPGAINVPVSELPAKAGKLKPGRVVVYCASGARSAMARSILKARGFEAFNLGGMHRW
jgi:rhodanese-related sulfurtransferase